MTLALNTGHALYGNIVEFIGVDSGALVSLVTSRTFTPRYSPTFGSGTYGEHMQTDGNVFSWSGATFSPSISYNLKTGGGHTVLFVCNAYSGNGFPFGDETDPAFLSFTVASGDVVMRKGYTLADVSSSPADTSVDNGSAHMVTITRVNGDGPQTIKAYVDGSLSDTSSDTGVAPSTTYLSSVGGMVGSTGPAIKIVYLVVFDTVLTSTEISDLYSSLGASNAFALLSSGDTTAPVLTSPTGTQTGSTTATIGATTDEGNGTLYGYVSTSATPPSDADLKAGTGAVWSGSAAVSGTGANTLSVTGLTASTGYYGHLLHTDAAANDSNTVTSAQFTTTAGAGASAKGANVARRSQSGINSFGLRR